ncbi:MULTISPECIES: polysaccharide deacetylase family protein [unclassified Haladaptatus]|uniref:polysaccharide deacetylase family protein n=1 Tax=unclassified Haladaptatus TaxID=2622732 RepID=UPI00209C0261|nr:MULTISPECIES: polysaccharide deacetylase family protein [unclassified Haladaptatus]MCO8246692.1 polysaccharide deacetylase family protein [Haladaptatus sp. AB643]MCO8256340.1 polysaccharide deacetylase family protein [Haladaptatus sp. AB618]
MTATVSMSIELELKWGEQGLETDPGYISERRSHETQALRRLLSACDEYDVPISFDVVGYLLHPEYIPPEDDPYDDDWWPVGPESSVDTHPRYYAPDLVEEIVDTEVDHEICTHTYSHLLAEQFDDDHLDWELDRVEDLYERNDLQKPVSFVAPRHHTVERDVLSKHGIRTIRIPIAGLPDHAPGKAWYMLRREHPVAEPRERNGIVEVPSTKAPSLTTALLPEGRHPTHPGFRPIPKPVRRRIHQRYLQSALDRALVEDSHVHLWTHLFNMSNDDQWLLIREFLRRAGQFQRRGGIDVVTLQECADRYAGGV